MKNVKILMNSIKAIYVKVPWKKNSESDDTPTATYQSMHMKSVLCIPRVESTQFQLKLL